MYNRIRNKRNFIQIHYEDDTKGKITSQYLRLSVVDYEYEKIKEKEIDIIAFKKSLRVMINAVGAVFCWWPLSRRFWALTEYKNLQ